MPYEKTIHLLQGGAVIVECGPMRLVIDARIGKVSQMQAAVRAAVEAVRFLGAVSRSRPFLGQDYPGIDAAQHGPIGPENGRQRKGGRR